MKLAQLFSDFEEELIRQGEEAESLSFVYRSLKNLSFTDFVFALQQEVTKEEENLVEDISVTVKKVNGKWQVDLNQ